MDLAKEIGLRVRHKRDQYKWTREKLAERAGISIQFLADIETGRSSMTTNTLYKIATALNVSTDHIIFGTDHPSDTSDIAEMLSKLSKRDRDIAIDTLKYYVTKTSEY